MSKEGYQRALWLYMFSWNCLLSALEASSGSHRKHKFPHSFVDMLTLHLPLVLLDPHMSCVYQHSLPTEHQQHYMQIGVNTPIVLTSSAHVHTLSPY